MTVDHHVRFLWVQLQGDDAPAGVVHEGDRGRVRGVEHLREVAQHVQVDVGVLREERGDRQGGGNRW